MTSADELEDLLNKEQQVLMAGQLQDLESIAYRKHTLFEALGADDTPAPDQLRRLRSLAERNASLLDASGKGIKAAIRQIKEANAICDQSFYGPDGERSRLITRTEKLEQKI